MVGKRGRSGKATFEDYVDFCENPKENDLTNNHLNQIIIMHGFRKLYSDPKRVRIDALSTIDLMVPFRSTLKENISSLAFLTLEEVKEDLSTLQWQECSVHSIATLNNKCASSTVSKEAGKSKSKRKQKSTKEVSAIDAPAPTPVSSCLSLGSC